MTPAHLRKKAFVSFDLLFCALPLLFMISLFSAHLASTTNYVESGFSSMQTLSKLVSIADYVVKMGAAEKEEQVSGRFSGSALYHPNVIDDAELSALPVESLRSQMELEQLEIGWDKGEGACIYRIVLHNKKIEKLYVCGG